jgi:hypothetical protein
MRPLSVSRVLVAVMLIMAMIAWGPAVLAGPASPQMSSANYAMDWVVVGEVSGGSGSSAHYQLHEVTIGQTAANTTSASASYALCTGWECSVPGQAIYLPVVLKK